MAGKKLQLNAKHTVGETDPAVQVVSTYRNKTLTYFFDRGGKCEPKLVACVCHLTLFITWFGHKAQSHKKWKSEISLYGRLQAW